ncbi:MAG: nuclease-related domain-containing protein, partial [Bacilli bacterium]
MLSQLDTNTWTIRYDQRMKFRGHTFQMDALVLSKYLCCIIECKYYAGQIELNEQLAQCTRTEHGSSESLPDPISQVKTHEIWMSRWLNAHGYSQLPILPLVAFTHPNAIISFKQTSNATQKMVVQSKGIFKKITELERFFHTPSLTDLELEHLCHSLEQANTPLNYRVFKKYDIAMNDILPGVICGECRGERLVRIRFRGECPKCGHVTARYFQEGLAAYKLLFGHVLTREEFRWWF